MRESMFPQSAAPEQAAHPGTGTVTKGLPPVLSPSVAPPNTSLEEVSSLTGIPSTVAKTGLESAVRFSPTRAQVAFKRAFWGRFIGSGMTDTPNAQTMLQLMPDSPSLPRWLSQDLFSAWVLETSIMESRMEYLAHLAMDAIEDVLQNTDAKAQAARASAALKIVEMQTRQLEAQAKLDEESKKNRISRMSQDELKEFIRASGISLPETVTPGDK